MAGIVEVVEMSANPVVPRSHAEIGELFAGSDVVEPGVVPTPLRRPERDRDDDVAKAGTMAGVGRER